MGVKLVVTDLDGTLLKSDKTISDRTREALARLKTWGIPFVIATARPIRAVDEWLSFLSFDAAIYHNGAVVRDFAGRLHNVGIARPADVLRPLLAEDPGAQVSVEANDTHYANFPADEIWPGMEFVRTADFHEVEGPADKLILRAGTPEELRRFERFIPADCYAQISEGVIAMVMRREATKLNGVRLLCKELGISPADVAAFGDDLNDVELLAHCGYGVAVENALDDVKAAARQICPTNDEDGPARWLEAEVLG